MILRSNTILDVAHFIEKENNCLVIFAMIMEVIAATIAQNVTSYRRTGLQKMDGENI